MSRAARLKKRIFHNPTSARSRFAQSPSQRAHSPRRVHLPATTRPGGTPKKAAPKRRFSFLYGYSKSLFFAADQIHRRADAQHHTQTDQHIDPYATARFTCDG